MAKGDRIKVKYALSDEAVDTIEVVADKAGRSVELSRDAKSGMTTIEVLGRAGTAARTVTIRSDKILMTEEIPA